VTNVDLEKSLNSADLVVVGSGFFGATIANLAAQNPRRNIVVLEKRNHIGGNAYSYIDESTGIEVHKYGSHLFHTSNQRIWDFVNQFDSFTSYRHYVFSKYQNSSFSFPINLSTINQFFGKFYSPTDAQTLIKTEIERENLGNVNVNFETKAISLVGRSLYDAFIRGYTAKQWNMDPKKLPSEIISRIPVRFNFDGRYFSDLFEGLPTNGYTYLINKMLNLPNISVFQNSDYFDLKHAIPNETVTVYSGPIDRFFGFSFGTLNWRTLDFEFETIDSNDFQGNSVINYADEDVRFTRIHEFKHLHPERNYSEGKTIIAYEFSRSAASTDEPYYPVNSPEDREKLDLYRKLAARESNTVFGGRLGSYKYLDMHMAIASAINKYENVIEIMLEKKL